MLANGDMVLMAGEIELDAQGKLTRWLNKSGLYMPPRWALGQSGLPFSYAWLFVSSAEVDAMEIERRDCLVEEGALTKRAFVARTATGLTRHDPAADSKPLSPPPRPSAVALWGGACTRRTRG